MVYSEGIDLARTDFTKTMKDHHKYKQALRFEQKRLAKHRLFFQNHEIPVIIVFEGTDAAGKGGTIKRVTQVLDPRAIHVYSTSAPTLEEKNHHYMWRFWKTLPPRNEWAIYDRSWYGRVLVERIEGFATQREWKRAYQEIREFERWLYEEGYYLIKFWLQTTYDEQYKRFMARKNNPLKQWKLTSEDWRNREKWELYQQAAQDMFNETNVKHAPWVLIPSNNKEYARVETLRVLNQFAEEIRFTHKK